LDLISIEGVGAGWVVAIQGEQAADVGALSALQQLPAACVVRRMLSQHVLGRLRDHQAAVAPGARWSPAAFAGPADRVYCPAEVAAGLRALAARRGYEVAAYVSSALREGLHGIGLASAPLPDPLHAATRQASNPYADDNDAVTAWLPERVHAALGELTGLLGMSRSDGLRNCIFAGIYGRLAYERAVLAGAWSSSRRRDDAMFSQAPSEDPASDAVRASRPKVAPRVELIGQLGKSTVAFRAPLPALLKRHLDHVATQRGMPTSELLRRLLAAYLLGRAEANTLPLILDASGP